MTATSRRSRRASRRDVSSASSSVIRSRGRRNWVHALGSGFIVDAQGHIVTNNHVVKDATDIQVTLADGRKLPAKVIGVDPKTDLAVLQVKSSTPLPHLALGDSNAARVGDWVWWPWATRSGWAGR